MPAISLAKRSAAPKQAAPVRVDPRPRPLVGNWTTIKNRRPDRFYIWVNKEDTTTGVDYYLSLGMVSAENETLEFVVNKKGDGLGEPAIPCGARKDNEPWEFQGCVLMSCPQVLKDYLDQYGADGNGGLASTKVLEDRIQNRSASMARSLAGNIPMYGRGGQYFGIDNQTGPSFVEDVPAPKE